MKASITADFMLFVVALIVLVIIMSTAFGKGVLVSVLGYFAAAHPQYLAEEFSIYLTAAGHTPGNFSAKLKFDALRHMEMRYHDGLPERGQEISVAGAVVGTTSQPSHAASFLPDTSYAKGICNATHCYRDGIQITIYEDQMTLVNKLGNNLTIDVLQATTGG